MRSPSSRATLSALVASPHSTRCLPQSQRSPVRDTGFSGTGGASLAFSSSGIASRSSISLGLNPVRDRSEVRLVQFLQFQGEHFFVPIGPGYGAIHHQSEGFDLRIGPLIADHRNSGCVATRPGARAQAAFRPQMPVHHGPVASGENRNFQSTRGCCRTSDRPRRRSFAGSWRRRPSCMMGHIWISAVWADWLISRFLRQSVWQITIIGNGWSHVKYC